MTKSCRMILAMIAMAVLSLGTVQSAQAMSLGFVTSGTLQKPDVAVWLYDRGTPALGAFDINFVFNPSLLSPLGVVFGTQLGDPFSEAVTFTDFGAGSVEAVEISLLDPAALLAMQPDSFLLCTINFSASGTGLSPLEFTSTLLSDQDGVQLFPDFLSGEVATQVTAVPEPGTITLVAAGLALLAMKGKKRRA